MKIGFVCMNFYPYRGGCEDITFNIARELVKKGHKVEVYCSDMGKKLPRHENIAGIHIYRSKRYFKYRYYLDFTPGIIKDIIKADVDILHVQSIGFIMNDIGVFLKKLLSKTKIVNTPHGPFMALQKYSPLQEILKYIYRSVERHLNRLYDGVVQVNPAQWRWMVREGFRKHKIVFLPNSIPEEMFITVNKDDFEKKYNLKGKLVLSYIGRIQKYKGLDQIIEVLPSLMKVNKDIIFLAMGSDAGDLGRLKTLAKKLKVEKHVLFTGFISDEDKLKGLDSSDIFVFPSEWEAFGIVLLEAMARKNAVISTKTEGGRYVVEEGINGYLYDFKDKEVLKGKLLEMIKDKKTLLKMQKGNYKKALKYQCSEVVKDYEKFYLRVLRR